MDIYDELGIRKIINCAGTYTIVGGSRMGDAALKAMADAAHAHVSIKALQQEIHARLAELTLNEAACVTPGAMAGICLVIASCISMKYQKLFKYIDKKTVENAEIIMFRAHRNPYDRGLEILGVKLVELGYPNNISIVTAEEFENAITENTTAVLFLPSCDGGWVPPGALDLQSILNIAAPRNIPVVVDAAAQLPPKSNLWSFTQQGASAAVFSGGKDLKGPQTTGLVLGKSNLLQWVHRNNFPNYGLGRIFKVGREELAGIYVAVREYVQADEARRLQECEEIVASFVHAFMKGEDQFYFERTWPNEAGQPIPRARLRLSNPALTAYNVQDELASGDPSIFVMIENGYIYINPMTITAAEAETVLQAFHQMNKRSTRS